MNLTHTYVVNLHWDSMRKGTLHSPEFEQQIEVATPPPFPKGTPGFWSPEHLFTAAVSSCFMTTFLAISENSRLEFESFTCNASGKIEQIDGKFAMSEVVLTPRLVLLREEDRDKAERILHKTDDACLISNSIKSDVIVKSEIIIADLV